MRSASSTPAQTLSLPLHRALCAAHVTRRAVLLRAGALGLVDADSALEVLRANNDWAFTGALAGVLLFGPLLSIVVLTAKVYLLNAFETLSKRKTPQELIRLQRAVTRAKLASLGVLNREPQRKANKGSQPRRHTLATCTGIADGSEPLDA